VLLLTTKDRPESRIHYGSNALDQFPPTVNRWVRTPPRVDRI
jgi:hypothetical protein